MDFRQYDNAIGRFHGMDRLAELTPGITPYRFGFNNPNFWSDPTGLFETWFDAIAHMLANNMTGEIVEVNGVYEIHRTQEDKTKIFTAQIDGQIVTGVTVMGSGKSSGSKEWDGWYIGDQSRPYTMQEFISANRGLTRQEIIHQQTNRSATFFNSQPGGPTMRYVINPHDGKVIDMRHMLVIGNLSPIIGNLVEFAQWAAGQESGMHPQDFYSNEVGHQFYMQYSGIQNFFSPSSFTNQLESFFNNPPVIIAY